jgi:hypothetical protein
MRSRRYSDNTVKNYSEALNIFLKFYANKPIEETEIYTHISTKNLQNIKSPFDDLGICDHTNTFEITRSKTRHVQEIGGI